MDQFLRYSAGLAAWIILIIVAVPALLICFPLFMVAMFFLEISQADIGDMDDFLGPPDGGPPRPF